jgi:hypothetical protein
MTRRRARPEDQIQRALFQHIRIRGVAGLVAIHVPMGGFRRPVEAKILQGLGATKGVPDVLLWHAGKSYALELKSEDGRLSESQADFLRKLATPERLPAWHTESIAQFGSLKPGACCEGARRE